MGHPDFRVGGKIFATLPADESYGVVMLSPNEQKNFMEAEPTVFSPVPGGWGRKGSTRVDLEHATVKTLQPAMSIAWQKRAPSRLMKATITKR
jgi:hypothetical protein